jgi:N-acetylglucosaminyl-diphospho-decaprenol L-rhamnosyltransferase
VAGASSDPDVSIVIVAHSVRNELERCLGSIRDFAELPVQTILVDNASTDGTVPWVRRSHPSVEVIELSKNIGTIARDHGLRRARGRFTMFLDSDAALTAGALPVMVEAMERNRGWGLIGPRLVGDDGSFQLSCRRFPPPLLPLIRRPPLSAFSENSAMVRWYLMTDVDHSRPRPVVYVLGACQLFRTSLGKAVARRRAPSAGIFFGPDDVDWCIRMRDAGGEIVYFPAATVIHSYRRESRQRPISRHALRHLRAFAALQWRYRRRRQELDLLATELDRKADSAR